MDMSIRTGESQSKGTDDPIMRIDGYLELGEPPLQFVFREAAFPP
jgi:hypothetical protein